MKKKTAKIVYRIGITLTSVWFAASGFFDLTKNPAVREITLKLGYPDYFIYLLGVTKLAGIIVLLIPGRLLRLKEWVFAGLFFEIFFAFISKFTVLGFAATIDTIVAFVLVSVTYLMFHKLYRMSPLQAILTLYRRNQV